MVRWERATRTYGQDPLIAAGRLSDWPCQGRLAAAPVRRGISVALAGSHWPRPAVSPAVEASRSASLERGAAATVAAAERVEPPADSSSWRAPRRCAPAPGSPARPS